MSGIDMILRELHGIAEHSPQNYRPRPCNCGDRVCTQWQVSGLSPELRFYDEGTAVAVADLLNAMGGDGT